MRNDIRREKTALLLEFLCNSRAKVMTRGAHASAVPPKLFHTNNRQNAPTDGSNLKRNFTLSLCLREKNFQKRFAYGDDFTVLF